MAEAVLKKKFKINKKDFVHAGEASINAKNLLKSLDIDPKLIRRAAICGYEGEMNVVMHGGEGNLELEVFNDRVVLEIIDDGPGIENIEQAMEKGFSTATEEFRNMGFGAGMGLPNMKKNSDQFYIESGKVKGTKIRMIYNVSGEGG